MIIETIVEFTVLHHNKKQFIANLCKQDACGPSFSDITVPIPIPMSVVARRRLSSSVSSAIRFRFRCLACCFVVENARSSVSS